MIGCRLRIRGRVQGVCYRAWTVATARELGLSGWVRNCTDGSVEALAGGDADAIGNFIERCRVGPPGARVDSIERKEEAFPTALSGFEQRRSADGPES